MKTIVSSIMGIALAFIAVGVMAQSTAEIGHLGALDGVRHRVVISTDIGGTDPDDFQSMVHLLLYADVLDIEGLVSSPYGPGRKQHILDVIDAYEQDFPNLKTYSDKYPTPDALRAIAKQGETERAPYAGFREATEGSDWIVQCARRDDPRPLYLLVWGGIEDLAQALNDAPDIKQKIRVYWIGGPNKKWGPDAYQYIAENHRDLWIIENNATYRGWFVGGDQAGEWGNDGFVTQHIAGHGALGEFFVGKMASIKMGDTPSVGWVLRGDPADPTVPGWGGQFVHAWTRPLLAVSDLPMEVEQMEVFGVLELKLVLGERWAGVRHHSGETWSGIDQSGQTLDMESGKPEAWLKVENQSLPGYAPGDGTIRFRFSPKAAKPYTFTIESNMPELNGKTGKVTAMLPPSEIADTPDPSLPHWWTDDLASDRAEFGHHGAATVSRWREDFLRDFAGRMQRCVKPASN